MLWNSGIKYVAGVDEAGRGPLAGPVTAGVVCITSPKQVVKGVRDSKLMTRLQREKAYAEICSISAGYGIGIIDAAEIDRIGIAQAVKEAMLQALKDLEQQFSLTINRVLVDGSKTKPLENYQSDRILKGGLYHYTIAAGSILAKVTRDRIMKKYAKQYPQYEFEDHVGYGTRRHLEKLHAYGPSPIHRKSYEPVRLVLPN